MEYAEMEYVGFWRRVGATIIDTILLMLITVPASMLVYGPDYFTQGQLLLGPADLLINWLAPAIVVVWLWIARGQTPGKMAIGAKIVDAKTGQALTPGKAVLRYLGYFISLICLAIGYLWVGFDPRKQGWHDHIAGTVVIRKRDRRPEAVSFQGR